MHATGGDLSARADELSQRFDGIAKGGGSFRHNLDELGSHLDPVRRSSRPAAPKLDAWSKIFHPAVGLDRQVDTGFFQCQFLERSGGSEVGIGRARGENDGYSVAQMEGSLQGPNLLRGWEDRRKRKRLHDVIVTRQLDLPLERPIELLMSLVRSVPILALVAAAGCRGETETPERPVVAVSVLPQAYFVERIAGDRLTIAVMIPPGANPSTFEPGIEELTRLARAKLYVAVGHPHFAFEAAWVEKLLSENPALEVVQGEATHDDDPHVWLSPRLVRSSAERIWSALGEVLPEARGIMEENLAGFLAEIDELDAEIHDRLKPYAGRKVFVFHAAWGHFAREYGLEQVSLEEGGKRPGAGALAAFIEEAKRENANAIFVQPQFSRESARVVAEEVGARVEVLDPLARDWLNNMKVVAMAFEDALTP